MAFDDKEKNEQQMSDIQEVKIEALQGELEQNRSLLQDIQARYMQLLADVENMKKRAAKDHEMHRDTLLTLVFTDLLSVVDNFDRALAQSQKTEAQDSLFTGVSMIHASMIELLKKWGVQEMPTYEQFDPFLHEALMQVENPDQESGSIAQVLQKGYMINSKVLRPAKVSVVK